MLLPQYPLFNFLTIPASVVNLKAIVKKEVILAIFIGFAVGLVITFGIWTANNSLRQAAATITPTPAPSPTPEISTTPIPPTPLTITNPADELLTTDNSVTISGKTAPSATVTILTESGEFVTTASSTGSFSQKIDLEGGYNRISVTAFDSIGNSATVNLLVTYTASKI